MSLLRSRSHARGFTLIEWLITVAIVALVAALATPSIRSMRDKALLKAAAQALYGDVQMARSEALRRGAHTTVQFTRSGSSWCSAIGTVTTAPATATCTCTSQVACIKRDLVDRQLADFPAMGLVASSEMRFEPASGRLLTSAGGDSEALSAELLSAYSSRRVRLTVSPLGMPSLCAPATGGLTDYPACAP